MTELNQKTDIGELGQHWHERLKELRLARTNKAQRQPRQAPQADNSVHIPADEELFAGTVHEELTSKDIFAGDDSTYEELEAAVHVIPAVSASVKSSAKAKSSRPVPISLTYSSFSPLEISLAAGVLIIVAVLIFEFFSPFAIRSPWHKAQQSQAVQPTAETVEPVVEQVEPQVEEVIAVEPSQPATLQSAQQLYLKEEYPQALEVYTKLYENPSVSKDDLMKDFLQLQMALCAERIGQYNQAAIDFRRLLYSRSPVVRVMAGYHCGLLEMHRNDYLSARTKAYQAIALIDAVDFDKDWAYSFRRNCYFLAAQAMTKEVVRLCDTYGQQPAELWPAYSAADEIFLNLDESKIYDLLNSGTNKLLPAALGPQVQKFDNQGGFDLYNIVCDGASIEELVGKFSFSTQINSKWDLNLDDSGIRRQLVYLYLRSAQTRQFATVAAGCAGLLADTSDNGLINIYNPSSYSLLSEHLTRLSSQAVSQWREFVLMFPEDERQASVHFALGLLYVPANLYTESISEYKLVANRFARSPLAPYALVNLANIRCNLKDYHGAYEDLRQLTEQFPDSQVSVDASLYYADTAFKADLKEESARIYKKVYNSALTPDVQVSAAFGAGKSSYMVQDYEDAEKWLTKYLAAVPNTPSRDLYQAYLYLARTYLALDKIDFACEAMNYAMQGASQYLQKEEYIDVIPSLVDAYMKNGSYVQALNLLGSIDMTSLTQDESVQVLILKSKMLRAMGLIDRALTIFGDRVEYTYDKQLRSQIYFELSQSYRQKGDLNTAGKLLSEVVVLAKAGPLLYDASISLANICLELGNGSQAISVCRQLLELEPEAGVKQKALEILAAAYKQNKNYDSAALALLGQWK
ncbi:MAG: tetratricopeptide repeat protein [Planctomycetaceae bacterium]|nr:tetratricopeptide repeat protein [Planctomycetaceae bacterium]